MTRRQRRPSQAAAASPAAAKQAEAAYRLQAFGRPSTYSLSRAELAAHIGDLYALGWQWWELQARFGEAA